MKRIIKGLAILFAFCFLVGSSVNAASYKNFPTTFTYVSVAPTSSNHITQTVEVKGGEKANAYAKCTKYSYRGNKPVLSINSVSSAFPTESTSFTGTTSSGNRMKYTEAIPLSSKKVVFRGTISHYSKSVTIAAQVKG